MKGKYYDTAEAIAPEVATLDIVEEPAKATTPDAAAPEPANTETQATATQTAPTQEVAAKVEEGQAQTATAPATPEAPPVTPSEEEFEINIPEHQLRQPIASLFGIEAASDEEAVSAIKAQIKALQEENLSYKASLFGKEALASLPEYKQIQSAKALSDRDLWATKLKTEYPELSDEDIKAETDKFMIEMPNSPIKKAELAKIRKSLDAAEQALLTQHGEKIKQEQQSITATKAKLNNDAIDMLAKSEKIAGTFKPNSQVVFDKMKDEAKQFISSGQLDALYNTPNGKAMLAELYLHTPKIFKAAQQQGAAKKIASLPDAPVVKVPGSAHPNDTPVDHAKAAVSAVSGGLASAKREPVQLKKP